MQTKNQQQKTISPSPYLSKRCNACGLTKLLSEFPRETRAKDGFRGDCKLCTNAKAKSRGQCQEPPDKKRCTKCRMIKEINQFNKNAWRKDGYQSMCRECIYPLQQEDRLLRNYNLDIDTYQAMLEAQDGKCKICHRYGKRRALSVDHCHDTKRVRGLLCWPCNRFLGHIKDDPIILQSMIEYLK